MRDVLDLSGLRGRVLRGEIWPCGDKSISHRALMLAALASGESRIENLNSGLDVMATAECLRQLGVAVTQRGDHVVVRGRLKGHTLSAPAFCEPSGVLNCGNSGTTMRLLLGLLAGHDAFCSVHGDASLNARPMGRVTRPLVAMGARVDGRSGGTLAPLGIRGHRPLLATRHLPSVASAQIKSALLLAGLFAAGTTEVTEPVPTRDHTERMLSAMGADLGHRRDGVTASVVGPALLEPLVLTVPGDISAAAFPLAAALLVPGSRVVLRNVGLNPGRVGMLQVLQEAGARIAVREVGLAGGEPVGDLEVSSSDMTAFSVDPERVPTMIDEVPLLCLLATAAHGVSRFAGLEELRVKESDRLGATIAGLRSLGADVDYGDDVLLISGPTVLGTPGPVMDAGGDHRMAMTWAVASLVSQDPFSICGGDAIAVSDPGFVAQMAMLTGCEP